MRAQGLEDLPHDLEALVVVQCALRRHARRHGHGQDDVPEILALRAAHHTAHRLDDIHLRLARRQEEHRVQCGHVHALAQAACVRQDAAHRDLVRARALGQPIHFARTRCGVHRAVHVAALDLQVIRRVVVAEVAQAKGAVHQVRELIRYLFRSLNVTTESHGAAHRRAILTVVHVRTGVLTLRQCVPAARQLRGRVEVQLAAHLRDQLILLGDLLLTNRQDDDLVVCQQVLLHRLAKAQTEEHRTVGLLIVHRGQDRVLLRRPILRVLSENTRRRRHVQGLGAADELVAVDLREGALVLARQRRTRRAVGLVANHQVEVAPLVARNLLRAVNDLNRLVRCENDLQALCRVVRTQGVREALCIRGGRDR